MIYLYIQRTCDENIRKQGFPIMWERKHSGLIWFKRENLMVWPCETGVSARWSNRSWPTKNHGGFIIGASKFDGCPAFMECGISWQKK